MNEIFLGFYLGTIFSVLLFNLQWFINTKERSYLYYILMQVSLVFLILKMHNTSAEIPHVIIVFFIISFALLFIKEFLNLKIYYPTLTKYINTFIGVFFIFCFSLYLFNKENILGAVPLFTLFIPFIFLGYTAYKKGFKLAKYFMVGWGVFVSAMMLIYFSKFFDTDIIIKSYIIQCASVFEALVLSYALSQKTKRILEEKNEQEKMLIHQARLASMGEMLANIAHQWRQPLNRISSFIMNMQMHIFDNYEKETFLLEKLENSQEQLEYMSHTIDDFSNFYKKDKSKENFLTSLAIKNAINIVKSTLKSKKVDLELNIKEDFRINSYPKELAQVILNILQNAKEQLRIRNIKNPKISIIIEKNLITIEDNARGIDEKIIDNIFEPYFTTKDKHKGTGLGLYMSRMILERNFNASINAQNVKNGALFIIKFKKTH